MQWQKHSNCLSASKRGKKYRKANRKKNENTQKRENLVETNGHNNFTSRALVSIKWDVAYLLFQYIAWWQIWQF